MMLLMPTVRPTPLNTDVGSIWLGIPCKFEIVQQQFEIHGYQLYAVEKWIVQRTRPITVLVVYTGDPSHKITVTALSPSSSLSQSDSQAEWESALHHLRRDGARPKNTPSGILYTTSLANFRSDFTIVLIPQGNFLAVKDQLYTNIGLLRMGCIGRMAVGLEDVSETTKDKFLSMYHLPDPIPTNANSLGTKNKSHSLSSRSNAPPLSQHTSPILPNSPTSTPTKAKNRTLFNATVLELVKLIQSALAIYGFFPLPLVIGEFADGLLCDITVQGIQKWIGEIGANCCPGVQTVERVLDPSIVSALLSLVLASRNKLAALGYNQVAVPKDPFLHPHSFCAALAAYITAKDAPSNSTSLSLSSPFHMSNTHIHSVTHTHTHTSIPSTPTLTDFRETSPTSPQPQQSIAYLNLAMIESINTAFSKTRSGDPRKMHRVLLNKLDDIATDLRDDEEGSSFGRKGAIRKDRGSGGEKSDHNSLAGGTGQQLLSGIGSLASGLGLSGGSSTGASGLLEPTSDLGALVRVLIAGQEAPQRGTSGSLKVLWSGKLGVAVRMRERERERQSEVGKEKTFMSAKRGPYSDGDSPCHSDEDENGLGMPWSGRMQKRIENWTKLSRPKKGSLDISRTSMSANGRLLAPALSNDSPSSSSAVHYGASLTSPTLPPVQSRDAIDDDELLSSGQVSPIFGATPFMIGTAESSAANLQGQGPNLNAASVALGGISDYDKRVQAFEQKRPWPLGKPGYQGRMISWSSPVNPRNILDDDDEERDLAYDGTGRSGTANTTRSPSQLARVSIMLEGEEILPPRFDSDVETQRHRKRLFNHRLRRRHSFHDITSFEHVRILAPARMRIDVGLCGQLLVMRRREEHLENVLACLQVITSSLSTTNAFLREDHHSHQLPLSEVDTRAQIIADVEAERVRAETMTQERNTLLYESQQFRVHELWRMASPSRQKVLDLREKVFGTGGRRLPPGVKGAHGRFNRVQWTLDGNERLVDVMGRTESEVEEEDRLVANGIAEQTEEDEEDVVEHPGIKPMWLLRFFTSWGDKWSVKKEELPKENSEAPSLPIAPQDNLSESLIPDAQVLDGSVSPVQVSASKL